MKNLKIIILLFFITFTLTSCKPTNNNTNEEIYLNYFSNYNSISSENIFSNIKSSDTKLYYAENKYVSFSATSDLSISFKDNDIVLFDDGTAMAKLYSTISIVPADLNFSLIHNGYYANFSEKKILSKISTGTKSYTLNNIELSNFKIVNATLLSCIYEDFEIIGNMIYYFDNTDSDILSNDVIFEYTNEITSPDGRVFYTYLKDNINYNNLTNDSFISNIEFNFTTNTISENITCINFTFNCITNNETFYVYSILKDSKGKFYFVNIDIKENNIYSITDIELKNINYTTINF